MADGSNRAASRAPTIRYSVVIPCYDEEPALLRELQRRVTDEASSWSGEFEVVVVDDGSGPETRRALRELHERDARWKVVRLSRNYGHQAAVSAGLEYASGDAVMVMDADLQDPPELLTRFIEEWKEGHDVVYAVRARRKEGLAKRVAYRLFYRILDRISNTSIPLDSGDFGLMDRRVVDVLTSMPEQNRFVRGLRAWVGFDQTAVEYERDARQGGEPKYSFGHLVKLAIDGIFSFSVFPLRVATILGLTVSAIAFLGAVFTLLQRLFADAFARIGLGPVPGFATIVISILFIGGVQLVFLGVIGEYLGRVYDEVKRRPLWIVRDTLGIEDSGAVTEGLAARSSDDGEPRRR